EPAAHDLGPEEMRVDQDVGSTAVDDARHLVGQQANQPSAQQLLGRPQLARAAVHAATEPLHQVRHVAHQVEVGLAVQAPERRRGVLEQVDVLDMRIAGPERLGQCAPRRHVTTTDGRGEDEDARDLLWDDMHARSIARGSWLRRSETSQWAGGSMRPEVRMARNAFVFAAIAALLAGCAPDGAPTMSDVYVYGVLNARLTYFYGAPAEIAYEGRTVTLTEPTGNERILAAPYAVRSASLVDGAAYLRSAVEPLEEAPVTVARIPMTTDMQVAAGTLVGDVVYFDGRRYLQL